MRNQPQHFSSTRLLRRVALLSDIISVKMVSDTLNYIRLYTFLTYLNIITFSLKQYSNWSILNQYSIKISPYLSDIYSTANLRDLYVDAFGNVLTGKLFEDLDALAGNVAFLHCDDNNPLTRPLSLVTGTSTSIICILRYGVL